MINITNWLSGIRQWWQSVPKPAKYTSAGVGLIVIIAALVGLFVWQHKANQTTGCTSNCSAPALSQPKTSTNAAGAPSSPAPAPATAPAPSPAAQKAAPKAPAGSGTTTPTGSSGSSSSGTGSSGGSLQSASSFPSAANTGIQAGITLADATSDPNYNATNHVYFADQAGETVQNLDIHGYISVSQNNITIKNVRVHCDSGAQAGAIHQGVGVNNTTILNVEIVGSTSTECQYGVLSSGSNLTVKYSNISVVSDAISPNDGFDIEENYIHDFTFFPGDHVACVGYDGGNTLPFTIRHNTCDDAQNDQNNLLALYSQNGPISYGTIDNNWLAGSGHEMWAGGWPSVCSNSSGVNNVHVTNNYFSTKYWPLGGYFGAVVGWCATAPGNVWSGNVWADGPKAGQAVTDPNA